MASPFSFIPRAVKQKNPILKIQTSEASTSASVVPPPDTDNVSYTSKAKGKEKESNLSEEDYVILVSLALSHHALWSDTDLRFKVDCNDENFIPLSYLIRHSQVFAGLNIHETPVAKALRNLASDVFDVRMVVSGSKDGLYEVRRKDSNVSEVEMYTRDYWDRNTVYTEHIPVQYRTLHSIYRFIREVIPNQRPGIECISFPPHHMDKPGDVPKPKGFAFVTFSKTEDVDALVKAWPWVRRTPGDSSSSDAHRFGFRTLPKARWEELKEEYLAYRSQLAQEIASVQATHPHPAPPVKREREPVVETQPPPLSSSLSTYPTDCLVFVRNIHLQTNKTTLRTLFSHTLRQEGLEESGIDYVDYNKGLDSCHLRLTTPNHSRALVKHFAEHQVTQSGGLDDKGSSSAGAGASIKVELVQGKREEVYWEKVPLKIRQKAMSNTLEVQVQEELPKKRRKR